MPTLVTRLGNPSGSLVTPPLPPRIPPTLIPLFEWNEGAGVEEWWPKGISGTELPKVSLIPFWGICQPQTYLGEVLDRGWYEDYGDESMSEEHSSGWGTQPGSGNIPEYNRKRFYIESTNDHNHSASVRPWSREVAKATEMPETVTMPPEIVAQIHAAVDHPLTKYRTVHDFFRDAVVHRLHDIDEMHETGFENYLMQHRMMQEMIAIDREDEALLELVNTYSASVEKFYWQKNAAGISDVIAAARKYSVGPRHHLQWIRAIAEWEKKRDDVLLSS